LQFPMSLLKVRPIPEIFLPLRSRIYCELSATNVDISAIIDIISKETYSYWQYY